LGEEKETYVKLSWFVDFLFPVKKRLDALHVLFSDSLKQSVLLT